MSAALAPSTSKFSLKNLSNHWDMIFTLGLFGTIVLLVLPVPTFVLDVLLAASIGSSLLMLLVIIYVKDPPEFSAFPTILLAITLFRLALNVASTRLILGEGFAGHVIEAFGKFVVQGNYLVGAVVFFILVVINFVVITKGAGRIAEVAARFTLDALPGKQMAIDAELNAGIIDETTATTRRKKVQKEADFYGAMDGANKFVRGDAMAAILITLINVVGGFAIGILQKGMPFAEALQKYTLMSIGDGLVSQVPALIVSIAAGLLVTRTSDGDNLSMQVSRQLVGYPKAVAISAGMLLLFAVVPGLPAMPFLILGGIAGATAYFLYKKIDKDKAAGLNPLGGNNPALPGGAPALPGKPGAPGAADPNAKPVDEFQKLIESDVFAIELGYGLLRLADKAQGGDLLDRITGVRKSFARDMGMVIPRIAIRDNLELEANEYRFVLRGKPVARAQVIANKWLAMNVTNSRVELKGIPTVEPVFGLEAMWIGEEERKTAEINGYSLVDSASVLVTHLAEILKQVSYMILSRQEVQGLLDRVKESNPALIAELLPDLVNLGIIQRVLQNLLKEGISIRNLAVILEAVADYAPMTKNPDDLSEQVRRRMGTYFVANYEAQPGIIKAITLDPRLEQILTTRVQRSQFEVALTIDPVTAQHLLNELSVRSNSMIEQGLTPVVTVSAELRLAFKRFFESSLPKLNVLAYQELPAQTEIHNLGIIVAPNQQARNAPVDGAALAA